MGCGGLHAAGEGLDGHARAVLAMCDRLTDSGHVLISANTDAKGDPQIFAQSDEGELAFYFVRREPFDPDADTLAAWVALAEKHDVAAYFMKCAADTGAVAPQVTKIR